MVSQRWTIDTLAASMGARQQQSEHGASTDPWFIVLMPLASISLQTHHARVGFCLHRLRKASEVQSTGNSKQARWIRDGDWSRQREQRTDCLVHVDLHRGEALLVRHAT
jgi:hypothetical protein